MSTSVVFNMDVGLPEITGIFVDTPPTKTEYSVGEIVDMTGAVIKMSLANGVSLPITSYGYSPAIVESDTSVVTISAVGFTTTTPITVAGRVAIPTFIGDPHYMPSIQWNVNRTNYWSGYDTTKMTMGGTTVAENIGNYVATFTLRSGYQWSDGTTSKKSVTWSIRSSTASEIILPDVGVLDWTLSNTSITFAVYSDAGWFTVDDSEVAQMHTSAYNFNSLPMTYTLQIREQPFYSWTYYLYFTASATAACPKLQRQPIFLTVNQA